MQSNNDIRLLEFPMNVRGAPGMYIGDTATPSKVLSEIVDNAFDEVQFGADYITITTKSSHYIVTDNGRGMPVKVVDQNLESIPERLKKSSQAELAIATLHSGSKFSKDSICAGLNGVGAAVTNSLSVEYILLATLGKDHIKLKEMHPELQAMYKGEDYHFIHYRYGKRVEIGFMNLSDFKDKFGFDLPNMEKPPSTLVAFQPDPQIFDSVEASLPQNLPYVITMNKELHRNLKLVIDDEEFDDELPNYEFKCDCTIKSSQTTNVKNPELRLVVSFGLNKDWGMHEGTGSVNGLFTPRGLHIRAFTQAFSEAWTYYYGNGNGVEFYSLNYWVLGLCNQPQFGSQTKLDCCTINGIDIRDTKELVKMITKIFKNNPEVWDAYAEKVRQQLKSNKDLSRVDYIKSRIVIANEGKKSERFLPAKLRDCTTNNRSEAELWIIEGRSAAGTLMIARKAAIHAVLGLQGMPMNAVGASLDEVLNNSELRDYISCIGLGVDEHYQLEKIRYGKVVIAADGDADGMAIASSIMATTARHMRFLIENGFLYVALAPLYEQDGRYFYTEDEFKELDKKRKFTRFKGLTNSSLR